MIVFNMQHFLGAEVGNAFYFCRAMAICALKKIKVTCDSLVKAW